MLLTATFCLAYFILIVFQPISESDFTFVHSDFDFLHSDFKKKKKIQQVTDQSQSRIFDGHIIRQRIDQEILICLDIITIWKEKTQIKIN